MKLKAFIQELQGFANIVDEDTDITFTKNGKDLKMGCLHLFKQFNDRTCSKDMLDIEFEEVENRAT